MMTAMKIAPQGLNTFKGIPYVFVSTFIILNGDFFFSFTIFGYVIDWLKDRSEFISNVFINFYLISFVAQKTKSSNQVDHFRFIPSPIQNNMVPGVHGERILSSMRVLPGIPKGSRDNQWHMKPIPERNGNSTGMSTIDSTTPKFVSKKITYLGFIICAGLKIHKISLGNEIKGCYLFSLYCLCTMLVLCLYYLF